MRTTTVGIARIALEVIDFLNGLEDEEAAGALTLLLDFLKDVQVQRSQSYWNIVEWGKLHGEGK